MAFQSGTITADGVTTFGYDLLFDELVSFLTTNTDLVTAGQEWTTEYYDATGSTSTNRYVYLNGPGLAGTDEIHVNIIRRAITGTTYPVYNWAVRGATAYDSEEDFNNQPGTSNTAELVLWDESMPYWFMADGRRFIMVAKVSNLYISLYCGFFLPYATSDEYPYPLTIIASSDDPYRSYLESVDRIAGFFNPTSNETTSYAPGYVRLRDGTWTGIINATSTSTNRYARIWPWYNADEVSNMDDINIKGNYDGSFTLIPSILHTIDFIDSNKGACLGELSGVYWVSGGFYNEPEDIIQVSSDNYLVVPSANRIDFNDFAAIKEE
jgi:hypothetical protein